MPGALKARCHRWRSLRACTTRLWPVSTVWRPVKEVAQVGAAIGREFSSRLLAPVLDMNAAALDTALGQLVDAGLLVNHGGTEMYAFKHALTRDAAYASLLRSRRQICHQRIANALEQFDDGFVRATEPELLAYHFQEAGDFSAALGYWIAAGDVAEQHSGASEEAVAHYRSARRLTERTDLPEADRARTAEVLLKLGNAQMQTVGYHSEEPLQSYRQARDAALAFTNRTRPRIHGGGSPLQSGRARGISQKFTGRARLRRQSRRFRRRFVSARVDRPLGSLAGHVVRKPLCAAMSQRVETAHNISRLEQRYTGRTSELWRDSCE